MLVLSILIGRKILSIQSENLFFRLEISLYERSLVGTFSKWNKCLSFCSFEFPKIDAWLLDTFLTSLSKGDIRST